MASNFPFITDAQFDALLVNGRTGCACHARDEDFDPLPVVKLLTPDAGATWLLTEIDSNEPKIAFGLCDLEMGFPELERVGLTELCELRGML